MINLQVFAILCLIIGVSSASGCRGCVSLDEHSFEKILPRFDVTLLKFDDSYAFGDKHNTFTKIAADIVDNQNIILGQVGVKYYGEKDNQEFAKRFGISSKTDLPSLRLFVQGEDEPFVYSNNMPWTEEDIKKFIRDHSNIYLGLPGCLETFDKLAMKFKESNNKEDILKEAEKQAKKLTIEKEKKTAQMYIKLMKKMLETGASFIKQEENRLTKILNGKINDKKKEELSHRLNILRSLESRPNKTEL